MILADPELLKQRRLESAEKWKKTCEQFTSTSPNHIRNYFIGIPDSLKKCWYDAKEGKSSGRKAIKAKCQDCVAYANVKEEIANCAVDTCPLWKYRPYKK